MNDEGWNGRHLQVNGRGKIPASIEGPHFRFSVAAQADMHVNPYWTQTYKDYCVRNTGTLFELSGAFFYWTLDLLDTLLTVTDYNLQSIALSLFHAVCLQFTTHALAPLGPLSPHKSYGTSFQRQTFPFLGSQTVPAPQPQQFLTH
jgi:hypothetical protein